MTCFLLTVRYFFYARKFESNIKNNKKKTNVRLSTNEFLGFGIFASILSQHFVPFTPKITSRFSVLNVSTLFFPHEKHFLEGQCHRLIANDRCEICFVISPAQKYSSVLFFSLARSLWHSRKSTILLLSVVRLRVCILSTKRLLLDMNFAELWHHQNSFSDFKAFCAF